VLPPVGSSAMRSRARSFEDFADTSFTPPVGQLIAEMSKPEGERDQGRVQRLHQSVERVLDYLNHELQGNNFLAGDFSVADIGFAPRMLILNEIGIDVLGNNRNNIDAWIKRMLERPSIRNLQGVAAVPVAGG
jgi:glutathione S-transferase